MNYDKENRTFDCEPTLTDSQVLEFCRNGYLILDAVVADDVNQRSCDYLDGKTPIEPIYIPEGLTCEDLEGFQTSLEPSGILLEEWFIEHVLLNPQLAGALRSLLGKNVGLPAVISHHRAECPAPSQGWHHDADCVYGPEVNFVEVFYYPQDTPRELGPTEIVPGSHIRRVRVEAGKEEFREISQKPPHFVVWEPTKVVTDAPAGSIIIHHQSVMHRKGASTAKALRRMLKHNYWRTVPPERDWIIEPDFDFQTADYWGHGIAKYIAHMFYWLCGNGDEFRIMGGQAWPWHNQNQIGKSYGFGLTEGYRPNWRNNNVDDYAV